MNSSYDGYVSGAIPVDCVEEEECEVKYVFVFLSKSKKIKSLMFEESKQCLRPSITLLLVARVFSEPNNFRILEKRNHFLTEIWSKKKIWQVNLNVWLTEIREKRRKRKRRARNKITVRKIFFRNVKMSNRQQAEIWDNYSCKFVVKPFQMIHLKLLDLFPWLLRGFWFWIFSWNLSREEIPIKGNHFFQDNVKNFDDFYWKNLTLWPKCIFHLI